MKKHPWVEHIYKLILKRGASVRQIGGTISVTNGDYTYSIESLSDGRMIIRGNPSSFYIGYFEEVLDEWENPNKGSGVHTKWTSEGSLMESYRFSDNSRGAQ